jgi:DNA polymerase phi
MPSLRQALFDLACAACDGTASLNAQQMRDLLKLAMMAIHQTKKLAEPEKIPLIWQPVIWDELCEKLLASKRFKNASPLKTTCKRLAQLSQSAAATKAGSSDKLSTKRKAEEVDGREKPKEVKRKKIKKNKA